MQVLLKKLSGMLSAGSWFSGHPEIRTVEMTSDLPAIEELIQLEEWPLVREDLEVSHCQPGAVLRSHESRSLTGGVAPLSAAGKRVVPVAAKALRFVQ